MACFVHDPDFAFEFGRGYTLSPGESVDDQAVIVSSGRGVYEALAAAEACSRQGLPVGVVDMPSVDEELFLRLYDSGKVLFLAEQNNGFLWQNLLKILYRKTKVCTAGLHKIITVNTLTAGGKSGLYPLWNGQELTQAFDVSAPQLAEAVRSQVEALRIPVFPDSLT